MASPTSSTVQSYLERWADSRILPASEVPCAAPFVTLEFGAYGAVQACCANALYPIGDIRHQSIRDVWEGFRIGELREAFRNGNLGPGCGVCRFRLIHTPGELPRNYYDNFGFSGGETPQWPIALSFSLHNSCNLACVMCGGDESSKIRSVRDQLPPLPHVYGDKFFEELRPFLEHCEFADFVGGEPFLIREHERVWDMLIEMDSPVRCSAATNGTVWNERVEHVLNRLDFQITVSVDGVTRETFESIRVGASFDEVYRNIERFREYTAARNRPFTVRFCLIRQNWFELGDMLRWGEERNIPVIVQTVIEPEFGVQEAPTAELRNIVDGLRKQDNDLRRELKLNLWVWERELRRLEDELESRAEPSRQLRQMRGTEFDNATYVEQSVIAGPLGGPCADPERRDALLTPWLDPQGTTVRIELDQNGRVTHPEVLSAALSGGNAPIVLPPDCRLGQALSAVSELFGGGVWLSEEFVEDDLVEHVLFLGPKFRDKTGLIVRMVSWHGTGGEIHLEIATSSVLQAGGLTAVPVVLGSRSSAEGE
jgi:hypothetical protein